MYIKKLFLIFSLIGLVSCNSSKSHPEYVEISGRIVNAKSKEITIYGFGYKKIIKLNNDGSFKDTLKVKKSKHQLLLNDDQKIINFYFENGKDVRLNANMNDFKNTLKFDLDFADYNNFLVSRNNLYSSDINFNKLWYRESESNFNKKIKELDIALSDLLDSFPNISKEHFEIENTFNQNYTKRYLQSYKKEHSKFKKLAKGLISPVFENYENYDGSKTSLSDFRGKYVYIDVWATWCGPCKYQIPFLKKIEKEFHGKNIVFVSISVDKKKDYEAWRNMVKDKSLTGIQLYAPNDFNSNFVKEYEIKSIPRFILIDTKGKIVDFDAERPSNSDLKRQLNKLL